MKNRDEHGRNILQEIFRFGVLEQPGVLLQFICDLVNDETAVGRESIVGFPKQCAFLFNLQNTKRNAGQDVIACAEAAAVQLKWQGGSIPVYDMHARIVLKLPLQISCQRRVQFKQKQMRVWSHASRDFARVYAFSRPVFRDHACLTEIHLACDAFHQRF